MKRFLRALLSVVFVIGVIIALWPLGQNAYGLWSQHALRSAWQDDTPTPSHSAQRSKDKKGNGAVHPSNVASAAAATETVASAQDTTAQTTSAAWPSTRLIIPAINLDVVVVQGWGDSDLRQGPGHCPASVLPGEPGNCLIAGHRNVYGSWFYRLDELTPGAEIKLRTHHETFTYKTLYTTTVSDMDTTLVQPATADAPARLTLLTCTLPHSTSRIAVIAEMEPDPTQT